MIAREDGAGASALGVEAMRRANLTLVLSLLHRGGPLSRARLTQLTGLNRSTIGALVAELSQRGYAIEAEAQATSRVGRPSPVVDADPARRVLAVNPEVDAVTLGVVGLGGRVIAQARIETDGAPTAAEAVSAVARALPALLAQAASDGGDARDRRALLGVGVAVPGLVRASEGAVRWAPHLQWRDEPVARMMTEALGLPAFVGNDASTGAVAEHLFGAARGVDDLIYLNGGASGIGGGVISGGRSLGGHRGFAGEFGHNRPGLADPADLVSTAGALEDEVNRARLLRAVDLDSTDESELHRALGESTSPEVHAELARQRRILAVALANAVNVLDPQRIVLGGFLAAIHDADPAELRRLVADAAFAAGAGEADAPDIRSAELGTTRLLIGAAELAIGPALLALPE